MRYVNYTCCALLTAIFVLSAGPKYKPTNFRSLRAAVEQIFPVLSYVAGIAAVAVVAFETCLAAALAVTGSVFAYGAALLVLVAFTMTLVLAISRHQTMQCHCFGADGTNIGISHVVRNVVLATISLLGLLSASGHSGGRPGEVVVVTLLGVVVGACISRWDDLAFALQFRILPPTTEAGVAS